MYSQRPPSAEETFLELVRQSAAEFLPQSPQAEASAEAMFAATFKATPLAKKTLAGGALPSRARSAAEDVDPVADGAGGTQMQFRDIYTSPENQIFKVVFFPDRIFHAQYLNATRAPERYRYAVSEARSVLDVSVLKARVFLDGMLLSEVLRIEYRASRLVELTRESGRFLRGEVIAWLKLHGYSYQRDSAGQILNENGSPFSPGDGVLAKLLPAEAAMPMKMHYCPWINAYQVEVWRTLEAPAGSSHHFQVLAQMGPTASITRVRSFSPVLEVIDKLERVEMAFRENDTDLPFGKPILNPKWDNNYERNYQAPNSPLPSDNDKNTVKVGNYLVNFQKGWFLDAAKIAPVRYRNGMMDSSNPEYIPAETQPALQHPDAWKGEVPLQSFADSNVIEMRWILQREFGGSVVFFHEVTIPPGTIEGTHCHVGSEELYYIVSGEGIAYMAEGDDPGTSAIDPATGQPLYKVVERHIYGLFPRRCVELPVSPGKVIFTKSGGIHGIRNIGTVPLKFVAFLYNSV